jgi:hypothetical protein
VPYWCATRLVPRREAFALHCLALAGYETYLPRLREQRISHGRKIAAKAASTTVPIVFTIAGDPVQLGLVASFNRPGGNVTGNTSIPGSIVSKQFEALHEAVPTATVIGCLLNPNNSNSELQTREAQEATRTLGRKLEVLHARDDAEIEMAFATLVQKPSPTESSTISTHNSSHWQLATCCRRFSHPYVRHGGGPDELRSQF